MLATRNALAKRVDGYAGCDGLKTGYHKRGGFSLAATATRNGRRIVSVVLGVPIKIPEMRFPEDSSIRALRCWKPVAKLDVLFGWA